MRQPPKYHNVKTRGYDSAKEAERARVLHLLEKAGKIRDLREQVRFELIPAQRENGDGKVVERACFYIADFVYVDNSTGETAELPQPKAPEVEKTKASAPPAIRKKIESIPGWYTMATEAETEKMKRDQMAKLDAALAGG